MGRFARWTRGTVHVAVMVGMLVATSVAAHALADADPIIDNNSLLVKAESANGSHVVRGAIDDARNITILVHSASMNRDVPVQIQRPADTSVARPTLYLLNGAGGGEDSATWKLQTNISQFLMDKNVNVVQPVGGPFSYYADWTAPDPVLGVNKWKTFLTEELPPLVNAGLGTNGVNAIAGISTSGTSVLDLAESAPHLYKSVAAYSGCAQIADPVGRAFATTVISRGGGNIDNLYGAANDPRWQLNDPVLNAEKLRGVALYVSSGNGMPGIHDTPTDSHLQSPGVLGAANQIVVGGAIEAATALCSHNLQQKLDSIGVPATYYFPPSGTHSWGYWEDVFKESWSAVAGPIGAA